VASFVTGLVVLLLWNRLPFAGAVHQVFPGVALSFGVYWAVAKLTPRYASEAIDGLFDAERGAARVSR